MKKIIHTVWKNNNIAVVATVNKDKEWSAYFGIHPGSGDPNVDAQYIVDWGEKLPILQAQGFFPEYVIENYDTRT